MKSMNKNSSRKTSAKKSAVSIKSEGEQFGNVDSLVVLSNPKERKRLDGIDERIKFLKTELRSLLGDMKMDKNSDSFADKSNSVSTLHLDVKRPEDSESDIKSEKNQKNPNKSQNSELGEFRPTFNSTPSKFSSWLKKTLNKLDSHSENEKPNVNTLPPSSEGQINLACETSLPESFRPSGMHLLTQESVEQLLFKSFLLQNSEMDVLGSQNCDAEPDRSASLTKQQKFKKSRKPKKTVRMERPIRNTVRPCRRYLRSRERKRLSNLSSPHSGIEIINLDSSSDNKIPDKNTICVDLDVNDYDWSEPFDINKAAQETHPGIQVLEYCKGVSDYSNHEELKSNSPGVAKNDRSICHSEVRGIQESNVWECPVCFERSKGQEIVATKCGHVFCRKCLEDHISKLCNNCPSCRCDLFTVQDKPFITLFNC